MLPPAPLLSIEFYYDSRRELTELSFDSLASFVVFELVWFLFPGRYSVRERLSNFLSFDGRFRNAAFMYRVVAVRVLIVSCVVTGVAAQST